MTYSSTEDLYRVFKSHPTVTTDTRKINSGDVFFALKGPNFNANNFALQALENGAAFAVVDDPNLPNHPQLLRVDDVLTALQDLSGYYRNTLKIPIIGITGSNGKTTTKELVHAVLSSSFKTSTTVGNLNNHIGIPLTLLRIPSDTEIAVIEMGANHQGEIKSYCNYAQPSHGLITNCGKAHLEGFGGEAGVRKGKGELFDYLKNTNGETFICSDFDYFKTMASDRGLKKLTWYGTNEATDIQAIVKKATPFLEVEFLKGFNEPFPIITQLVGDYNIYNVLAAVTIGKYFGVSTEQMKKSIAAYSPDNSRSQLIKKDGNTIVLDAYNANPTSMSAAIKNFASFNAAKKILIIGAMAELGDESLDEHDNIIKLIDSYQWEKVILVGGDFEKVNHKYLFFKNAMLAAEWWQINKVEEAAILLKGSRSMTMEKVL